MRIFPLRLALACGILGCRSSPVASPPPSPLADRSSLDPYIAQAAARDTTLDFSAFRLAYVRTPSYSPYGSLGADYRKALYQALDQEAWSHARAIADTLLTLNPVDAEAHILASYAARQLADTVSSDNHQWLAEGLVQAIQKSGDGTQSSPFVVISVDEEYVLARFLRLKPSGSQGLATCGRVACDRVSFTHVQTGRDTTLYFDVSLPLASIDRTLRQ